MNKEKKLHQRSSSISHFPNSSLIQSLMFKLQQSENKIKQLELQITNLVLKIEEKDKVILSIKTKSLEKEKNQQHQKVIVLDSQFDEMGVNTLGQSIEDITNVDQNQLNIKNRMESMKTFQINRMPTLFQRNLRQNRSVQKLQRVVSHSRILQLKPSNIRTRQPQSPTNLISLKDQLPIKQQPNIDAPVRLFQHILAISGDITQLSSSCPTLSPQILYSFPNRVTPDKERTIPLFCFPTRIQCLQSDFESQPKISQPSIFIFNSEYTTANKTNKTISIVNPNHYLYGIYVTTSTFIKLGERCYQVPITYVVITYLPFVKFWNEIIVQAIKGNKPQGGALVNEKLMKESLKQLNEIRIRSFPAVIRCSIFNKSHNISFDQPRYIDNQILSYSTICLSKLTPTLLADLLLCFLLEYSIVIYSPNKSLRSQLITLLLQLIKPLKYPYPIITDLPPEMQPMLDSPFPCILGVSNKIEQSQLGECHVYVDLDEKKMENQSREEKDMCYVFGYVRDAVKGKYGNEGELVKRLKYMVREEILGGKERKGIMGPFLERFRSTQMYKYNHQ